MGFFSKRSHAKIEKARDEGYAKAIQRGASEQEARAAGEKAAKKQKRRRAIIIGGANSGG